MAERFVIVPANAQPGKKRRSKKTEGKKQQKNSFVSKSINEAQAGMASAQLQLEARNKVFAQNKTRVESIQRKLTPYDKALIQQMMLPEMVRSGSAIISPAPMAARSQASHFRLEHVMENIPSDATVHISPTLYPLTYTSPSDIVASGFEFRGFVDAHGNLEGQYFSGDDNGPNGDYRVNYRGHTLNYQGKTALAATGNGGDTISVYMGLLPYGTYEMFGFDIATDVWVSYGTFVTESGTTANYVPTGNFSALALQGVPGEFVPGPFSVQFIMGPSQELTLSSLSTHSPLSIALPASAERYRITSLSVKLTYFGSDLVNQGEIAIARVYPHWSPLAGVSAWDTIATLPVNSFDGPVKFGAHAYWVPTDMKELDFREPIGEFTTEGYTTIWAALKGLDPTASVRVELDAVVEFYSPEPLYSKDPCPYLADKYGEIMYYLGMVNPCGDNPGHFARIAKVAKTVGSAVEGAAKTVATVGSLL